MGWQYARSLMTGSRNIEGLARTLLAPLLQLTSPSRSGWRLVGWDAEQGIQFTLSKGSSTLLFELERRDDERDCYGRTGRFNVCIRQQFREGSALSDEDHRVAAQVLAILKAREGLLPVLDRPATSRSAQVREIHVERVLIPEGEGHYYINPYVGCMIGCDFCYVAGRADFSRELEGLPSLPWGRYVDVKVNAAEVLREEVKRFAPGVVRMSPILTDPYQGLERRFRITRQCLEVLADAGSFIPVILTRAARVVEDLDLLTRFSCAAVGLSIPTDDDRVRRHFEPGGDAIEERLDALRRCHEAGLRTFLVVQPMLPMDPERLVELTAPYVRAVRVDRMYELHRTRAMYESFGRPDAMEDAFFDEMGRRLREGYASHGVAIDALDDLGRSLGLFDPARAST